MTTQSFDEMAAAMDLRMQQLAAQGVSKQVAVERMMGFVPQLRHIWSSATKRQLARLCEKYPRFYTFACLCDEVAEAIQQHPGAGDDPLGLPEALVQSFSVLFANAAALETSYQACLDADDRGNLTQQLGGLSAMHRAWLQDLERVLNELMRFGVPQDVMEYIVQTMEDTRRRIAALEAEVSEHAPVDTPLGGPQP